MYHIKLVDRISENETRSRVYPAIRYTVLDNTERNIKTLYYWEKKGVCNEVNVFSDKSINVDSDMDHCFEAYVMNENGETIEVIA